MTYLEALRRKLGVETIDEAVDEIRKGESVPKRCPDAFGLVELMDGCPEGPDSNCLLCWWRQAPEPPAPVVLEEVESYYPCTVQILRNPETGEESVGWFRGQMDGE